MNQKDIKDYFDQWGLIGQLKETPLNASCSIGTTWIEGGDSMQRTGFMHVALAILEEELDPIGRPRQESWKEMANCHEKDGITIRHPDGKYWYSSPYNCSRDQSRPFEIAAGFNNDKQRLLRIFKKRLKRFGFYQNIQHNWEPNWEKPKKDWKKGIKLAGDIYGPIQWGESIRSFNLWLLWPLLVVLDFFNLFGAIIACYKSRKHPTHTDYLNKIVSLVQSLYVLPTPVSIISVYIFFKFTKGYVITQRFSIGGQFLRSIEPNKRISGPQYFLDYYFGSPESPPLNQLWAPVISKINCMFCIKKY